VLPRRVLHCSSAIHVKNAQDDRRDVIAESPLRGFSTPFPTIFRHVEQLARSLTDGKSEHNRERARRKTTNRPSVTAKAGSRSCCAVPLVACPAHLLDFFRRTGRDQVANQFHIQHILGAQATAQHRQRRQVSNSCSDAPLDSDHVCTAHCTDRQSIGPHHDAALHTRM
jgi:hypothetical protein